jgi:hypothetical protein
MNEGIAALSTGDELMAAAIDAAQVGDCLLLLPNGSALRGSAQAVHDVLCAALAAVASDNTQQVH